MFAFAEFNMDYAYASKAAPHYAVPFVAVYETTVIKRHQRDFAFIRTSGLELTRARRGPAAS